jgi:hypothetical protein
MVVEIRCVFAQTGDEFLYRLADRIAIMRAGDGIGWKPWQAIASIISCSRK